MRWIQLGALDFVGGKFGLSLFSLTLHRFLVLLCIPFVRPSSCMILIDYIPTINK